jgi:hypothetical protein
MRAGLQYLLAVQKVDLLILPTDLRILHVAIPLALTRVEEVIAFPVHPEWEDVLCLYDWYTALRYSGRMVVQAIRSAQARPATYMYLFPKYRRACVDPVCGPAHARYTRDFTFDQCKVFDRRSGQVLGHECSTSGAGKRSWLLEMPMS